MTLQTPLASVTLKRIPAAMGKRAPRARSIDGWFCRQPWPESVADSVVQLGCHLALVAARAPLGVLGEGAQSGNTLATTPGGALFQMLCFLLNLEEEACFQFPARNTPVAHLRQEFPLFIQREV